MNKSKRQHVKQHILVADDEEHARLGIELILKKAGFTVTIVEKAKQVLDFFDAGQVVDVLVIDFQMTDMTAIDVVEHLVSNNISVPIVVISGYELRNTLTEKLSTASIFFLEKPFEPSQFVERVKQVIRWAAMSKQKKEENHASDTIVMQIIERHKDKVGELLAILQDVQLVFGYLPEQALITVAKNTNRSLADIFCFASSYKAFRLSSDTHALDDKSDIHFSRDHNCQIQSRLKE